VKHAGFHGRAGFGQKPALLVIDVNLGFTDSASPLACDLEDVVAAIRRLLDEFRRAQLPVVYTTVSYGEGDKVAAAAFIDKIPALQTLEAGSAGSRSTRESRRCRTSRC
jgi:maleamate amidohydrolase